MKKVVVFLLVLAMMSASVFAAGKTEAAPAGPVTLKVANYALLESGYEPFWKQVKVDFEAANPDITIEWVTAPYGEIVNQVVNMAGGGNKVDVIFGEIDWVPGLVDAGLAAPVRDILPQAFVDDFYPDVLKSFEVEGKPYGIPLYVSRSLLYYD